MRGKLKSPASEQARTSPRRPLSSYMFFAKETRAGVIAANPGINPREIVAKIGEMWRAAEAEEKLKYEQMAVADKERYEKEKQETEGRHSEAGKGASPAKKPVRKSAPTDDGESKSKKGRKKTVA